MNEATLVQVARHVAEQVNGASNVARRFGKGRAPGGDPQFALDHVAEQAVAGFFTGTRERIALYTEDRGLVRLHPRPREVLVIDPIDGTRPACAELEAACVSIALAPFGAEPLFGDVRAAALLELKSGAWITGARGQPLKSSGYPRGVPAVSDVTDIDRMFWSIEFNGHPASLMTAAYGELIDCSANPGAVFVFNSASYSLSRIVTGQLDAYVDIGNRLLRDDPTLRPRFERVGGGHLLHLFPYDIAAAVFLATRAGVVVTDAYGSSLDGTRLLDVGEDNQRSCVAGCTPELHAALLERICWTARENEGDGDAGVDLRG